MAADGPAVLPLNIPRAVAKVLAALLREGFEASDDIGMPVGDVPRLADVLGKVVQLAGEDVQFPVARAHGL